MSNVYFALTEEFNGAGFIALLASGQAVVFYRIALMSKDGDWVLREIDRIDLQGMTDEELERAWDPVSQPDSPQERLGPLVSERQGLP
jgi:hypothetical protein